MDADAHGYVAWGDGATYPMRIIGINHDDLATPIDGRMKAGLTFQFVELLNELYPINTTETASGAWGLSNLRAQMNPGTQSVASGQDSDLIWNQVPLRLQEAALCVRKPYAANVKAATMSYATDHLFLASRMEMSGAIYNGASSLPALLKEGTQYEYYRQFGTHDGNGNWDPLDRQFQCGDLLATFWWSRSVNATAGTWNRIYVERGHSGGASPANSAFGVCPAFCL